MNLALIYNSDIRNNGTAVYLWHAFTRLGISFKRYRPDGELPKHDFYLYIDDGRDDIKWLPPHPCGYYAIDTHLGYDYRRWKAKQFDIVWCAQLSGVRRMDHDGIRAHWLPLACDAMAHPTVDEMNTRGVPTSRQEVDIAFVGHLQNPEWSDRNRFLDTMFKAIPSFWFAYGVFHEDMAREYHKARIGINHAVRDDLNMRFFELASIGVPQLCDRRMFGWSGLGFREDEHFIGYSSHEEAVEKAKGWLNNQDGRLMAKKAHDWVRRAHTYSDRAREMLAEIQAEAG